MHMLKILIIEDEMYARKSMKKQILECLKGQDVQIDEAANGRQGIDFIEEHKPDLVFTDIRMPVMDGLELLKRVKTLDTEVKVVIISAYADFEYAKTALKFGAEEYLLKPIDDTELRECLTRFQMLKKQEKEKEIAAGEDVLTEYISHCIFADKTVKSFIHHNLFRKVFHNYQIAVLYFTGNHCPSREKLIRKMQNINEGEIYTGFRLIYVRKEMYLLCMRADSQSSFIQKKIHKLLCREGYGVYMGISCSYAADENLKEAYFQAMEAVESKIFSDKGLLFYEEIKEEKAADWKLAQVQKDYLKMVLEKGNPERAKGALAEIFREIESFGAITCKSMELFLTQMTVLFQQAAEKRSGKEEFKFQILDFQSLKEVQACILEKAEMLCRNMQNKKYVKGEEMIQEMKEYVLENYHKDISVKFLAEHVFFMNPAYLSHLFAEKTGESYSAYVKRIRMEQAKRLLREGKYSVTDIAYMTGYNDTSQFIRTFKNETGVTPKKYTKKGKSYGETKQE